MRPIKVSDARLYSRYKKITTALEEIGIVREPPGNPRTVRPQGRRTLDEPAMSPAGRDLPLRPLPRRRPGTLVEEFDRLEPQALAAIERFKEARMVSTSARSG